MSTVNCWKRWVVNLSQTDLSQQLTYINYYQLRGDTPSVNKWLNQPLIAKTPFFNQNFFKCCFLTLRDANKWKQIYLKIITNWRIFEHEKVFGLHPCYEPSLRWIRFWRRPMGDWRWRSRRRPRRILLARWFWRQKIRFLKKSTKILLFRVKYLFYFSLSFILWMMR